MTKERRLILQEELEGYFEEYPGITEPSKHVSFQPSEETQIPYPHVVYSRDPADITYADNVSYLKFDKYEVTCIDRNPDSPVFFELEKRPYCSLKSSFAKDGLRHSVFDLYH